MSLFRKPRYTMVRLAKKKDMPDGLWTKCEDCGEPLYNKALEENLRVCPKCDYHFVLTARERIELIIDKESFEECDQDLISIDPIDFKGPTSYPEKLEKDRKITGLEAAAITGKGSIEKRRVALAVTDSRFMMGSMGSVVGEKITRIIEKGTEEMLPVVIISGSGGGARMQEGMLSLMQMAKTSAALSRHSDKGLPYISLLTNPTMAGVMASFASLGDIIVAEPRALIGFTGPRVIEQTIRQVLPEGFQRSEFLLQHGLIDVIVHRKNLKQTLVQLLDYLAK